MHLSPSRIRHLRTQRGWSQELLAQASGLSLRTIQRVEAQGAASLATASSLAATLQVRLDELQAFAADERGGASSPPAALYYGLAVLCLAAISESGRIPGGPTALAMACVNAIAALVGALMVAGPMRATQARRHWVGFGLAVLGMPFATLLVGGLLYGAVAGRLPSWELGVMGVAGLGLVGLSMREFARRSPTPAVQ